MNKILTIPPAVLLASALCAVAADIAPVKITQFRSSRPAEIRLPAISDSTAKADFKPSRLMKYSWNADYTTVAQGTSAADKEGWLRLPASSKEAGIATGLKTNIRAFRYAKGKVAVTSPVPFTVTANGKSLGTKETVEDSITDASTKKFELELQPEYTYELEVKAFVPAGFKGEPRLSAEFIPDEKFEDIAVVISPDLQKRFSIETTVEGPRAVNAQLSPDGKYLLTQYSETFSSTNTRKWWEISETASRRIISSNEGDAPSWMPKRPALYQTVGNGDEYDLYSIEVPSMRRIRIAEKLPVAIFAMAPDESYIVYTDEVKGKAEEGPMKRVTAPDDRLPGNRDRAYLMKYSLKDGIAQPLTYGGETSNLLDISPDSRYILYNSVKQTPSQFPFYTNTFIREDVATLATDTIVAADPGLSGAIFSPDGKSLFAWGGPSALGGVGANQGSHPIANDFDTQGFIIDIATRDIRPVTRDFDPAILGVPVWNRANGNIYFRAYDGFYTPVYEFNPVKGNFRKLDMSVDRVYNFSIGADESKWLVYTGQSYDHAGSLDLLNLATNKSTRIEDPLKDSLGEIAWGEMQSWKFTASDGTEIDGNIILPPDFDASKKYPLIVYYYGGTTPSDRSMGHPYTPQLFASRDYVVYVINPSGTIGYGQEFSARHVNAWGKRTSEDIIEGVRELCKSHPFINDKKIGCLGASYGGFMTQYLLTKTNLFAAAVSHAGISNVASYWGEGYWGYSYNAVAAARSYPWTDPDLFTKQGSLFNADKIHTPLLLLHGSVDTNVPIGESIQLFNALRILGRQVEFITVEGQNHIITDYDKRVVWHATIMAWFAKWLQDDPRWWDSMYGK